VPASVESEISEQPAGESALWKPASSCTESSRRHGIECPANG